MGSVKFTDKAFNFHRKPINRTDILPKYIISEDDVYKKLPRTHISKSPGPDGIPSWVLKLCAPILAAPVASNFNESIQ